MQNPHSTGFTHLHPITGHCYVLGSTSHLNGLCILRICLKVKSIQVKLRLCRLTLQINTSTTISAPKILSELFAIAHPINKRPLYPVKSSPDLPIHPWSFLCNFVFCAASQTKPNQTKIRVSKKSQPRIRLKKPQHLVHLLHLNQFCGELMMITRYCDLSSLIALLDPGW